MCVVVVFVHFIVFQTPPSQLPSLDLCCKIFRKKSFNIIYTNLANLYWSKANEKEKERTNETKNKYCLVIVYSSLYILVCLDPIFVTQRKIVDFEKY